MWGVLGCGVALDQLDPVAVRVGDGGPGGGGVDGPQPQPDPAGWPVARWVQLDDSAGRQRGCVVAWPGPVLLGGEGEAEGGVELAAGFDVGGVEDQQGEHGCHLFGIGKRYGGIAQIFPALSPRWVGCRRWSRVYLSLLTL